MSNEEALRSLLADAAAHCQLPPEFNCPSGLVQAALAERRRLARRRVVVRTAVAAAVLMTGTGLFLVPPVRRAVASMVRTAVISIAPGTLQERLAAVSSPWEGPPEWIQNQADVDVAEALRRNPFLPALELEGWRLVRESASHEIHRTKAGWDISPEMNYDLTYANDDGDQIHISQRRAGSKTAEIVLMPETVETTLGNYPAYVSRRAIALREDGEFEIRDAVLLQIFLPIPDSDASGMLEVRFASFTAPLETVSAFAERFVLR